jgi:hypothetical protein
LRRDFSASRLRSLAKKAKDGPQARRLLTLAAIYDGATRTEAAKIGGVGLQIIRDWVLRFNAYGPDGLLDRKPPGQPSKLNDGQRQAVAQMIESGPIAGLRINGLTAPYVIDGAMDGPTFMAYVEQVLAPTLAKGCKIACNIDPLRGLFASNSGSDSDSMMAVSACR